MEDDQRMVELDSIYFHISTYTRNLNTTATSSDRKPPYTRPARDVSESIHRQDRQRHRESSPTGNKNDRRRHEPVEKKTRESGSRDRTAYTSRGSSRDSNKPEHKRATDQSSHSKRASSSDGYFTRKSGDMSFRINAKKQNWTRERVRSEEGATFYIPTELWPRLLDQRLDIPESYIRLQEDASYWEDIVGRAKHPTSDTGNIPIDNLKPFYALCAIFTAAKYNLSYRRQIRLYMENKEGQAALKKLMESNPHWQVEAWISRNRAHSREIHINDQDEAVVREVTLYEEPLFKSRDDQKQSSRAFFSDGSYPNLSSTPLSDYPHLDIYIQGEKV